ncbi:ABC transporter ATP-binding protein [uncultured Faecalicoccus sp.]|uniref:ABC transporter ATP-binding protein n=1 Tax=uncultured Faecalicoccus sp. TaxID=1971760 RepID=UPI0025F8C0E9|nr:ABC transporter ATP-binding protein [uncultured Faecalicoccus sp.]
MKTFQHFLTYYKPYLGVFFLDLFCAFMISIIDLAFPLILTYCTDVLFLQQSAQLLDGLLILTLFLLGMYLIRALCRYYVTAQGHIMGSHMERDMRKDLFDQYQRLSFSYYDRHNTGIMMSRVVSDLFEICEFAHHGPENLFISLIKIAGSFVILAFIFWPLALILFLVTMVMLIFSYFQNKKMQETFMDNRRKIGDVNASLQDSLAGIRIVQSFTNEDIEKAKFDHSNDEFLASKKRNYRVMGTYYSFNNFFQGLLYLTVIAAGGLFVAQGELSPLTLATFALYINIFVAPIDILVEFTEMFQKGFSGFKRFEEVMKEIPEIQDAQDAKELTDVRGDIRFEDVSFTYNKEESVLEHVDLTIPAGRKLALVGPSGSGKTTLCSLIPRFYDVDQGSVLVDGQDVRNLKLRSLRQAIGLVSQEVYLFSGTIAQNIRYGKPDATEDEIVEAAKKANIHDFIQSLPDGYDTYVGERGARLSGGQKQRISIARVFLKDPKILILDEATSALDNESERIIQRSLDRLSEGRTCITIAHRLSTIQNADEIVVIDQDGMKERGTHEDLLKKNGTYARYYHLQFSQEENEK